ncbi:MAG TPA: hypothetical protein VEH86_06930 [Candidatus Acidoferrum sp.]|nr:hypothetical protein [Candidatus Acidoferrum sp.]
MESETEGFQVEVEADAPPKKKLKSFNFFEEYSQRNIAETIQARRDAYERADVLAREELEAEAEIDVENFRIWLEIVKKLPSFTAHYYSISLKSLLFGLPNGIQIAQLFDSVLEKLETQ